MISEILKNMNLSLSILAQLPKLSIDAPIPPEKSPFLVNVESAPPNRKDGLAVWKYTLLLPGSAFSKLEVKVKEPTPSISLAEIESHNGMVKVNVEGFRCGFLDGDKGIIFFASAEKITPIGPPSGAVK